MACSISFYDYVVISGGAGAPQSVNVFNENGWVKELPSHIEGRWYHGCGHYNNDVGKLVSYVTDSKFNKFWLKAADYYCTQFHHHIRVSLEYASSNIVVLVYSCLGILSGRWI